MTTETIAKQNLAIALGMTLSDGSPIVVGGSKCPPSLKIIAAARAAGWYTRRLTKTEREDVRDDYGYDGKYAYSADKMPAAARAAMLAPSGFRDLTVQENLLPCIVD